MVPRKCIAAPELRLFQYTAIDEFTRLRFWAAYPEQSTYSSAEAYKWSVSRRTTALSLQTVFPTVSAICRLCSKKLPPNLASGISRFARIRLSTTARSSVATVRIRNAFIPIIRFILCLTSKNSLPPTTAAPTTCPGGLLQGFLTSSSLSYMFDKPTNLYSGARAAERVNCKTKQEIKKSDSRRDIIEALQHQKIRRPDMIWGQYTVKSEFSTSYTRKAGANRNISAAGEQKGTACQGSLNGAFRIVQ